MIRNASKVLDEKSNEFLNYDSQDSSTCPPLPSTPKDNLFSFESLSSSLEFHKKPSGDHLPFKKIFVFFEKYVFMLLRPFALFEINYSKTILS